MKLKGSVVIRKEIIKIFKKHSLSYVEVAKYLNTDYSAMIMWLNANEGGHDTVRMSESHVRKLCLLLGIKVNERKDKVQITLLPLPEGTLEIATNKEITERTKLRKEKEKIKLDKFFEE